MFGQSIFYREAQIFIVLEANAISHNLWTLCLFNIFIQEHWNVQSYFNYSEDKFQIFKKEY